MTEGEISEWCRTCGARHERKNVCRDALNATEPERLGWRVQASSETGSETFAVLIAQCGDRWRARIITLPSMLWSVPGGRATMKFVARTANGAEMQAQRVIVEVCRSRNLKMTKLAVEENPRGVTPEGKSMDAGLATRNLHGLRIHYGAEKPNRAAKTSDLSATGLFIATKNPLPKGRKLKMLLEMESASIPLQGSVIWSRECADAGRPAGMGIELVAPPALYVHLAEKLTEAMLAEAEQAEAAEAEAIEA